MDSAFELPAEYEAVGTAFKFVKGDIVPKCYEVVLQYCAVPHAKLREMALRSVCLMLLAYPSLARFDETVEALTAGVLLLSVCRAYTRLVLSCGVDVALCVLRCRSRGSC